MTKVIPVSPERRAKKEIKVTRENPGRKVKKVIRENPERKVKKAKKEIKVKKVTHLGEDIPFSTDHDEKMDYHRLSMDLPAVSLPEICVVAVEFEGELSYNEASYGSADF